MKVGIFGGTFNPPHIGHLECMQEVLRKTGLEKILVIPAAQNPLKKKLDGPTVEQRLHMTKLAVESWGAAFFVDEREVQRGGKSFTIDTITELKNEFKADDFYLIVGMDKFDELEKWKDIEQIFKQVNLIITSRPGFQFPENKEQLPKFLQKHVAEFDFNFIELDTEKSIQFVRIKDIPISGTELRKWLRAGKNVDKFVPLSVESFIKKNNLYKINKEKIGDYKKFVQFCGNMLFSRKAINVQGFDLRKQESPAEFTIVASGTSTRHATSLAENLIQAVKEEFNLYPLSIEGTGEGRWVVVDYGSLIVHIFYDFVRQEYSLEKLWQSATDLKLKDSSEEKK